MCVKRPKWPIVHSQVSTLAQTWVSVSILILSLVQRENLKNSGCFGLVIIIKLITIFNNKYFMYLE